MRSDSLIASVKYEDYKGTVAADRHDLEGLNELAQKYGIDTNKYFVFGVNVSIGETRENLLGRVQISILVVDSEVIKASSLDSIQSYIDENQGMLPYEAIEVDAKLEEFLQSFKRLNIVLLNNRLTRIKQYQKP